MPLTEKIKFETRLQKGNRVQVPKMVRWRFKLESYQILEVTLNPLFGLIISPHSFFTRMSKDGRIVIPKKILDLLRDQRPNLEGFMLQVTLAPS